MIANGTFDDGTNGWTATRATLSVQDGSLRVESVSDVDDPGPGLAHQTVKVEVGTAYELSARFLDSTRGSQVRAGSDVNEQEYGSIYEQEPKLVFTATTAEVVITLNNVTMETGEFAIFDDVVLAPRP